MSNKWKRDHPESVKAQNRRTYLTRRSYYIIREAEKRAKKSGVAFDLNDHAEEVKARINAGYCEISGVAFAPIGQGRKATSPSIDRIEPKLGYTYSNIRVIAWCLNAGFGDWGEHEFEKVVKAWLANRKV